MAMVLSQLLSQADRKSRGVHLRWRNHRSTGRLLLQRPAVSFVLLCDDPDAPAGTWHHWAAFDIGAGESGLAEGVSQGSGATKFKQAVNDFRRTGYGGRCTPHGHGAHRYHFRLFALSIDQLRPGAKCTCIEVERESVKQPSSEFISDNAIGRTDRAEKALPDMNTRRKNSGGEYVDRRSQGDQSR
jgi:Raf kinase inhibitor-like YbhB/YbcL family protein